MAFDIRRLWADIDRELERLGMPRTRENYIWSMFAEVPDTWCDEWEAELPPDLRRDLH